MQRIGLEHVQLPHTALTLDDLEVTGGQLVSSNGGGTTDPCDPSAGQAFGGGICSATTDDRVGVNPELPSALGANADARAGARQPVVRGGGACTDPTLTPPGPLTVMALADGLRSAHRTLTFTIL